jgi:transcription elongation factor Elf1
MSWTKEQADEIWKAKEAKLKETFTCPECKKEFTGKEGWAA